MMEPVLCLHLQKTFMLQKVWGKDEVRLAYVLNKEDLLKAADILKYGISEYNKEQ